ncbi:MAG: dockerin type I repeat-containing protein [Oscillospiraceae bacterium]|nr:dockerin type I repeat-containing protein [Oscillospiraceae bacterium]
MKKTIFTLALACVTLAGNAAFFTSNAFAEDAAEKPVKTTAAEKKDSEDEVLFDGMTADEFIEKTACSVSSHLISAETYNKFKETYGIFSVHGKYVVLCRSLGYMGSNKTEYTGTGAFGAEISHFTDAPMATCGPYDKMDIYKAEKPGEVNFNVFLASEGKTAVCSADLVIDDNLNITVKSFGDNNKTEPDSSVNADTSVIASSPQSGTCDLNSDGRTDLSDLTEMSLMLIGDIKFTENQKIAADVDHDSTVSLADLSKLKQYLSRVITSL